LYLSFFGKVHAAQQAVIARKGSEVFKNLIAKIDRSKLLLLKNLNHTGVVALSVLSVYYPAKGLAILRYNISAFDCYAPHI